jgi:hypothetical protein
MEIAIMGPILEGRLMKHIYLLLAILGAVAPHLFVIDFF